MSGAMQRAAALAAALVASCAAPATAEPITVFTQVYQAGGRNSDEIPVSGLGDFAVLTTGGGVSPTITAPADQASAVQSVVGFWPVIQFRDQAQYEAQRGAAVTLPETPVTLYAEVWNGAYGGAHSEYQRLFINAVVWGQVGAAAGQNVTNWRFDDPVPDVRFSDGTLVSLSYTPVRMPDGTPQIQFQDGSPTIGFPGPVYYPTLLDATIEVTRPAIDPPGNGGGAATTPEPAGAGLLAGFMLGGLAVRRARLATTHKPR
jgi:hypothetical protein